MGGYGSWNIALDNPHRFAAIVPVCARGAAARAVRPTLFVEQVAGETDPYAAIAQRLRRRRSGSSMALDDVVPPDDDRRLHAAFQNANARDVRYTEYPEGNHNAWDATYADPAMGMDVRAEALSHSFCWETSVGGCQPLVGRYWWMPTVGRLGIGGCRPLVGSGIGGCRPLVGSGIGGCRPLVGTISPLRGNPLLGTSHRSPIGTRHTDTLHAARQVRP